MHGVLGDDERSRQRDDAAHAGPADEERVRPRRSPHALFGTRTHQEEAGEEHPHEAKHDHGDEGRATDHSDQAGGHLATERVTMIVRACRPISRNTELSSRNAMLRQVSRSAIRDCAVCRIGDL